jgi:hypothetical protein
MPRKGRIDIIGSKFESREVKARVRELQELAAELHQEWWEREQLSLDDWGAEPGERWPA